MSPGPILAIDTATPEAAVALRHRDQVTQRSLGWRSAFREAGPAIEALLAEVGLTLDGVAGIAVPAGPGSFTGLRVGAALALALADLRGIPLFAPSTLAVVAEACAPPGIDRVCASLDARRGRRYAAVLERGSPGSWRLANGALDLEPVEVADLAAGLPIVSLEDERPLRPTPAAALTSLVAGAPDLYRLAAPDRLELLYARAGGILP
ncbi:MAG TPA: tRNA (adenosine(37)-N6)-threonylcarbamoyltransferase complex dimerization subunit type 1 TsaB [Gemmatimonadota bacterium]|nr:tRNA (adenosine(37)-N6)-threonylcarbamoyltransferase complex dimerization subunit type 1 TsaB [Gemmatimonadota bacterium]